MIFLLYLSFQSLTQGNGYDYQFLTQNDGLASNEVICGIQDRDGFIWFGTRNGLNRYDGNNFLQITKSDGLRADRITSLAEDIYGNIWIIYGNVNSNGINGNRVALYIIDIYNPISGKITPFEKQYVDLPFQPEEIEELIGNHKNEIYITTKNAKNSVFRLSDQNLFELSSANENFKKSREKTVEFQSVGFLNDRYLNITQEYPKLKKFAENDNVEYITFENLTNSKPENNTRNDQKETLSKSTENFKIIGNSLLNQTLESITTLSDRNSNDILFQSLNGLFLLKDHECIKVLDAEKVIDFEYLNAFFFSDNQGNLWIPTNEGVHKFMPNRDKFNVLFGESSFSENHRASTQIRGIHADTMGNVWTTGIFGLNYYDAQEKEYFHKIKSGITEEFLSIDITGPDLYIFSDVINKYSTLKHKFREDNISIETYSYLYGPIWSKLKIDNGQFLLGTVNGKIFLWDSTNDTTRKVQSDALENAQLGTIYKIVYSKIDDHYWAVGDNGCIKISKDLFTSEIFGKDVSLALDHQIPFDQIRDVYEDDDGILWLTTNGFGLVKWDRKDHTFRLYNRNDGLPTNTLYCLLPDGHGQLWVSSENGLIRFDKKEESLIIFDQSDGISNNEFNRISSFLAPDGTMYFGGISGLTSFHPDDFIEEAGSMNVPVRITGFNQFLKSTGQLTDLTAELRQKGEIHLNPGDGFFRLDFKLLDYQNDAKQYKYKIAGIIDDWEYLIEESVRISGLPYGEFILRIAGQSESGVWSSNELSIPITVIKPYYLRWWAYILYALFVITSLYLLWRFQLKNTMEKADKLRLIEINDLKTKLYSNITHEFRTPLTVIIGMANQIAENQNVLSNSPDLNADTKIDMLEKIENRTKFILRNADNLLQLINQMLDLSKLDSSKLKVNWEVDEISNFLNYIFESFHSYSESKNIDLKLYDDVKFLLMDFDRIKLQQIISNLLSNAIKFTPQNGEIKMLLTQTAPDEIHSEGCLRISVRNTGMGIPSDKIEHVFDRFYQVDDTMTRNAEGTGIGLSLVKELTDLIGGEISVESIPGEETVFTILFPIHKNLGVQSSSNPAQLPITNSTKDKPQTSDDKVSRSSKDDLPQLVLIEDNMDVQFYIKSCLEDDYNIISVNNGEKGIATALEYVPDIIISDVMMPIKNGYEVVDFLKNDERTSHIPIILLSAKSSLDSRIQGLEKGADNYLTKPFDKRELQLSVKNLLLTRKSLQSVYAKIEPQLSVSDGTSNPPAIEGVDLKLENEFILKIQAILDRELSNEKLEIADLHKELKLSYSQLYRKLKALTGKTIVAYIRTYRLHKANDLLKISDKNISEIAYQVGFSDPSYFTKMYSEEFGLLPNESRNLDTLF